MHSTLQLVPPHMASNPDTSPGQQTACSILSTEGQHAGQDSAGLGSRGHVSVTVTQPVEETESDGAGPLSSSDYAEPELRSACRKPHSDPRHPSFLERSAKNQAEPPRGKPRQQENSKEDTCVSLAFAFLLCGCTSDLLLWEASPPSVMAPGQTPHSFHFTAVW